MIEPCKGCKLPVACIGSLVGLTLMGNIAWQLLSNLGRYVRSSLSKGNYILNCTSFAQGLAESGPTRPVGSSPGTDTRSAAAQLLSLFGRRGSGSLPTRAESPSVLKRSASGTQPMCLICLENLTADDFQVCWLPLHALEAGPIVR